ncbi:hypothetical protein BWQ96_05434 [Gracilariopsis chorda]|uniref:Uncharacterized protein n=1 Tax=Gracilariopsis chorda TaxID=448386 RepID=A0A2V3IRN4_9FLOR|nr:hypothetical protein BWQ96_05434 [Gracilariopsis chorda]|eukprot:PXF44764.1 hypothetical protein BWQ96_05434 [Gracilariopsis chorda]
MAQPSAVKGYIGPVNSFEIYIMEGVGVGGHCG